jgi:hypothetical protein
MSEIDDTQKLISTVGPGAEGINAAGAMANELRRARDRALIVKFVGGLYVGSVALVLGYLIYRGVWCESPDAFANLFEVIKVAVIPIVTLVMGYYFALEKAG